MSNTEQSTVSMLIAEDDENIALAIQTVLKKAFNSTKIEIAYDGDDAWLKCKNNNFDIIISDWNMPGMTGQDLCKRLRETENHKATPFLMLTARSDKISVVNAIKSGANDYISKPYQKDQLIEKVRKLVAIAKLHVESIDELAENTSSISDEKISKDIIDYILQRFRNNDVELPILPQVYAAVNTAMMKDDVDVDEIIAIINREPAISIALTKIANSSFYKGASNCKTLEQAITRIGLEACRQYVFMIEGRSLFKTENKDFAHIMNKLWEHSLATATCSRMIAQQLNLINFDILFSMGLLHDIGKLALIKLLADLANERDDINKATVDAVFEELHTEIGAIVLSNWQFPREMINVAKFHHDLSDENQRTKDLLVVHLSNILVSTIGYSIEPDESVVLEDIESAKYLDFDASSLELIRQTVENDVKELISGFR